MEVKTREPAKESEDDGEPQAASENFGPSFMDPAKLLQDAITGAVGEAVRPIAARQELIVSSMQALGSLMIVTPIDAFAMKAMEVLLPLRIEAVHDKNDAAEFAKGCFILADQMAMQSKLRRDAAYIAGIEDAKAKLAEMAKSAPNSEGAK